MPFEKEIKMRRKKEPYLISEATIQELLDESSPVAINGVRVKHNERNIRALLHLLRSKVYAPEWPAVRNDGRIPTFFKEFTESVECYMTDNHVGPTYLAFSLISNDQLALAFLDQLNTELGKIDDEHKITEVKSCSISIEGQIRNVELEYAINPYRLPKNITSQTHVLVKSIKTN